MGFALILFKVRNINLIAIRFAFA